MNILYSFEKGITQGRQGEVYAANPHVGFAFYKNKIPLADFVAHEPKPNAGENLNEMSIYYKTITSPIGKLQIIASDSGLHAIFSQNYFRIASDDLLEKKDHHILLRTEKQLNEYFTGERKEFNIKLEMRGTVFQINAWRQLQKIPYGETISYGEQAARIGDIKKARAVGAANSRNPLLIIVPCHRVIGSSGTLTGFAGGIKMKQQLLDLEQFFKII